MKVKHIETGIVYEAEQTTSDNEVHGYLELPKGYWKLTTLSGIPWGDAPSDHPEKGIWSRYVKVDEETKRKKKDLPDEEG